MAPNQSPLFTTNPRGVWFQHFLFIILFFIRQQHLMGGLFLTAETTFIPLFEVQLKYLVISPVLLVIQSLNILSRRPSDSLTHFYVLPLVQTTRDCLPPNYLIQWRWCRVKEPCTMPLLKVAAPLPKRYYLDQICAWWSCTVISRNLNVLYRN